MRATLDVLKESALIEESACFDPSGSSGLHGEASSPESSERAQSWHGDLTSNATEDTELTGVSQGLESLSLQDPHGADLEQEQYEARCERLLPEEKTIILQEMFPKAKNLDITYTLKKTGNKFSTTVEELLNQAFLENEELNGGEIQRKKGIEAFTEPAINSGRGRNSRRWQRQLLRRTSSTPTTDSDASSGIVAPLSRWDRAKEDIDFIAQRTYVSPQAIASIYHKNNASLSSAVAALSTSTSLDLNSNPYLSMASPSILEAHAAELSIDFRRVPYTQLMALIKLTHPSTASAHELARVLSSNGGSTSSTSIVPQYVQRTPSPTSDYAPSPSSNASSPLPHSTAAALATVRSTAFTQAQSAYRKSKSKPLMGGAASYYSSVGRDASASLRRHEAAAADALVTTQSKPGEVDLHGVTVKDAVSIARARVESWWEQQGREWARQGKVMGGGLRVITGAGRHSEGGRGRLGPAVGGMLVREGWKVEVGNGVVEVVGRART